MYISRTIGQTKGRAAARSNHVQPKAPVKGVAMPVNTVGLTDAEERASLDQKAHDINKQA